jgi:hypothetical protein
VAAEKPQRGQGLVGRRDGEAVSSWATGIGLFCHGPRHMLRQLDLRT